MRAEIFIIFAATVLLGVAVGWVLRHVSPELRLVLVNVLVLLVVDLSVDFDEYGPYILILAATGVLVWLLRQLVTSILLASGVAFFLSTLVVSTPSAQRTGYSTRLDVEPDRNLPPVFHFVFDEHSGVKGLPSRGLREDLVSAYAERGFRVFPHSYSHYSLTHNSLPNLLNYTVGNLDSLFINASGRIPILSENRFFTALSSRGYSCSFLAIRCAVCLTIRGRVAQLSRGDD